MPAGCTSIPTARTAASTPARGPSGPGTRPTCASAATPKAGTSCGPWPATWTPTSRHRLRADPPGSDGVAVLAQRHAVALDQFPVAGSIHSAHTLAPARRPLDVLRGAAPQEGAGDTPHATRQAGGGPRDRRKALAEAIVTDHPCTLLSVGPVVGEQTPRRLGIHAEDRRQSPRERIRV